MGCGASSNIPSNRNFHPSKPTGIAGVPSNPSLDHRNHRTGAPMVNHERLAQVKIVLEKNIHVWPLMAHLRDVF